jgi:hypothetical protein
VRANTLTEHAQSGMTKIEKLQHVMNAGNLDTVAKWHDVHLGAAS